MEGLIGTTFGSVIWSYVGSPLDLASLACSCKTLGTLLRDSRVWEALYRRRWPRCREQCGMNPCSYWRAACIQRAILDEEAQLSFGTQAARLLRECGDDEDAFLEALGKGRQLRKAYHRFAEHFTVRRIVFLLLRASFPKP